MQYSRSSSSSTLQNFTTRGMIFSRYSPTNKSFRMTTPTEATRRRRRRRRSERLTDAVSRLSADGRRALDVRPGGGHVVVPPQLGQEMLDQIDEDKVPAGHDQMSKSHDGPLGGGVRGHKKTVVRTTREQDVRLPSRKSGRYLSDSQSGGGELREQTAEDGGVKVDQQTSLSAGEPTTALSKHSVA